MNQTLQLLTEVYANAETAKYLLGKLIKRGDDSDFRHVMAEQYAAYHDIMLSVQRQFANIGQNQPKGCGPIERAGAHWPMVLHGHIIRKAAHAAELLIHETVIRLIDVCRAIRACPDAGEDAAELAHRLRITEENHLRQMLRYV